MTRCSHSNRPGHLVAQSEDPSRQPHLSIVVPVYRSEDCLRPLVAAITEALGSSSISHEIILVNDASPDGSWQRIQELSREYGTIVGINLRKNFGQEPALLTGIELARGTYISTMDDDLQHDPKDLPRLIDALEAFDADVVYANFTAKRQASWKNLGSKFYDMVAEWVIQKPKGLYLSAYRMMRSDVAKMICASQARRAALDGLLLQVTSRIAQIPAEHHERLAGRSNYTFSKSVRAWSDLAFSFSTVPLRFISVLGVVVACGGAILALFVAVRRIFAPETFTAYDAGWASLMVAALLIGGAQMLFFGALGEYIGRIYLSASHAPKTSIASVVRGRVADTGIGT